MIRIESKPGVVRPPRAGQKTGRAQKPVVLIGKAMTYDSGGLSLKINNGMLGMKRDKDGGCAVLGAMHAIATHIQPRVPVVAFLAAAENAISESAYRPDDIIRYRNNVTVEVTNTDAEGRLVLADALAYACEVEKPRYIVDLATLTGGVVIALGSTYAGLFCEDDGLRAKLQAASDASGERIWRLPLHQEYRDMMKSPVADILNSAPVRKAHPIAGAAFLSYFVDEKIPWAHIDIAGVHAVDSDSGPFVKGPTGWGARLLANLLENE
jgi:leucyl aminopeptidase